MPTATKTIQFNVTPLPTTALGTAISQIAVGSVAQYAAGTQTVTAGGGQSVAHWSMLFHYDPSRKEMHVLGKGQDGSSMKHLIFSESNDSWRLVRDWGAGTLGHPYVAHTLDPATGDFYFFAWGNQFAQRYDRASDSWISNTATSGGTWGTAPNSSVAWHPNLYGPGDGGLVVLARQVPAKLYFWRKSTQTWSAGVTATGITYNTKEAAAEYSSLYDAVFIGGGDGGNNMVKVTPGPVVTAIAAAPIVIGDHNLAGISSSKSILTTDPRTGQPMIIEKPGGSNRIYLYDNGTNAWVQNGTHALNSIPSGSQQVYIACSIPQYKTIAVLSNQSGNICRWDNWRLG